jgi:hypothetical protein
MSECGINHFAGALADRLRAEPLTWISLSDGSQACYHPERVTLVSGGIVSATPEGTVLFES